MKESKLEKDDDALFWHARAPSCCCGGVTPVIILVWNGTHALFKFVRIIGTKESVVSIICQAIISLRSCGRDTEVIRTTIMTIQLRKIHHLAAVPLVPLMCTELVNL
jgi:hypothetical protein